MSKEKQFVYSVLEMPDHTAANDVMKVCGIAINALNEVERLKEQNSVKEAKIKAKAEIKATKIKIKTDETYTWGLFVKGLIIATLFGIAAGAWSCNSSCEEEVEQCQEVSTMLREVKNVCRKAGKVQKPLDSEPVGDYNDSQVDGEGAAEERAPSGNDPIEMID